MGRINSNIESLRAQYQLGRNQTDLNTRLQRLSTGLRINAGKDAPAGLIASETLRSEISGIDQALENTQRANNVLNTAEGSLTEVSSLLLELQGLTNEAANTGALSKEEIKANQLQVDAILNSVNRIANTTQFNGVKLLNGSLDYSVSGVASTAIDNLQVNTAKVPEGGYTTITVDVTASAQRGEVVFAGTVAAGPITIEVAGADGAEQLSFASGTAISAIAFAVNQVTESTGVKASASTDLRLQSSNYGSDKFVSVKTVSGTFIEGKDEGADAQVSINGTKAEVSGTTATVRSGDLDVDIVLDDNFATNPALAATSFNITGGGAKFQIGSQVNRNGQVQVGIGAVSTGRLGNNEVGFLSEIGSGGDSSLVGGNTVAAQKVITAAIRQVATLRGRIGALQKNVLDTNANSLSVAQENVTASESAIRDADFAKETSALTRAQILVQANTSVLAQANSAPQNVLSLLQR